MFCPRQPSDGASGTGQDGRSRAILLESLYVYSLKDLGTLMLIVTHEIVISILFYGIIGDTFWTSRQWKH